MNQAYDQKQDNQFVIFTLGCENYAVSAMQVREIICLPPVTRVPELPEFLKGVINLRGTILPVLDLKMKFGMPATPYLPKTCVIIISLEERLLGMIVDEVNDVIDLAGEQIAATPSFGEEINAEYISGLGKRGEELVIILDLHKIMHHNDIVLLHETDLAQSNNRKTI